jgi:hypothetical protein
MLEVQIYDAPHDGLGRGSLQPEIVEEHPGELGSLYR